MNDSYKLNTDFIAPSWHAILEANNLADFDTIWQVQGKQVEPINYRRGGWSGVSYLKLTMADGSQRGVYIKRQQNHVCKSWQYPLRGVPTFSREFFNILAFQRLGLPALKPLYFSSRYGSSGWQAILITEELVGFESLQVLVRRWNQFGWPALKLQRRILAIIATTIKKIHDANYRYGCFYPNHIFLKIDESSANLELNLIDFEKASRGRFGRNHIVHDLVALCRRSSSWSVCDYMFFYKSYLKIQRLGFSEKKLWRRLVKAYQGRVVIE
jgi:hypothetical protein